MFKRKEFQTLLLFSFGFLLLHMPFESNANLLSLMLEKNGYGALGFLSVGLNYFSWGIGSIFAPTMYRRLGQRWSMIIGAIANLFWILASMASLLEDDDDGVVLFLMTPKQVIYFFIIVASITNGFFNGVLWVAASSFVSECGDSNSQATYFSVFYVFFVVSQIFGNALAGFTLSRYS